MNPTKRKDRRHETLAYLELGGGREDPRHEVVRVDDEARGGGDSARREVRDLPVGGGGGGVGGGSQREGGEDSGDHASGGEHLEDVINDIDNKKRK